MRRRAFAKQGCAVPFACVRASVRGPRGPDDRPRCQQEGFLGGPSKDVGGQTESRNVECHLAPRRSLDPLFQKSRWPGARTARVRQPACHPPVVALLATAFSMVSLHRAELLPLR